MLNAAVGALLASYGLSAAAADEAPLSALSPYASEIFGFMITDEVQPPEPCATLFVGSSSIRFWFTLAEDFPGRKTTNRGFGGAHLAHVNDYFDVVARPHKPKEIILYAGENDLDAGKSAEDVLVALRRFMDIKSAALGETPVYFVSIKPSKARFAQFNEQNAANTLVEEFAVNRSDLTYLDVVSKMLEGGQPKDIFLRDGLHMNSEGYRLWAEVVSEALESSQTTQAPYCE